MAVLALDFGDSQTLAQGRIACGQDYVVKPGDTLSIVARQAYGPNKFRQLHSVNIDRMGPNPNLLEVGTALRIPCDLSVPIEADPAPAAQPEQPVVEEVIEQGTPLNRVEVVFNSASSERFVLNSGVLAPYFAQIERITRGRVRFTAPAVVDRDPTTQLDLVLAGRADGAYIFNGHLDQTHPLHQITMQPLIGGSAVQTATALWRVHEAHFAKANAFDGVKVLGFVGGPPAQLWHIGKNGQDPSIAEVADLAFESQFPNGGAGLSTEPKPIVALAHGAARALGVWAQARKVTLIDGGIYSPTFTVFISQEKWDQISPPDQEAIMKLSGEQLAQRSVAWDAADRSALRDMVVRGLTVEEPNLDLLAELQARAQQSWEAWISRADAEGIAGFEAINTFFKEIGALKKSGAS